MKLRGLLLAAEKSLYAFYYVLAHQLLQLRLLGIYFVLLLQELGV